MDHFIYLDRIQENREENTVFVSCRHFFMDIKKGDLVILTKNVPDFGIYSGMLGEVVKVLINQRRIFLTYPSFMILALLRLQLEAN